MDITYERKINYYETDRMGVVHHSNYIRFLEEARCYLLEKIDMPFAMLEENGVTIPVLGVNVTYKQNNMLNLDEENFQKRRVAASFFLIYRL